MAKCRKCGKEMKVVWTEIRPGKKRGWIKCGCAEESMPKASFGIKKYRDPVAFGRDRKTGRPVAVDKKGKRFDPSGTRYDLRKDPRGWKVTGKKVREKDEYGRKYGH